LCIQLELQTIRALQSAHTIKIRINISPCFALVKVAPLQTQIVGFNDLGYKQTERSHDSALNVCEGINNYKIMKSSL